MSKVSCKDWAEPFRRQADEDLRAVHGSMKAGCPSTAAMLLQMVFEKMAKAYIAKTGDMPPRTHDAFVTSKSLDKLVRNPNAPRLSSRCLSFVKQLTKMHPQLANKGNKRGYDVMPQLEFPWWDETSDTVLCPAQYDQFKQMMSSAPATEAQRYAREFIDEFNSL